MNNNIIKIGIGVMVIKDNKILLGHRNPKHEDTGGIYEPDSWTFPGGKQDYEETVLECAIREVKEETNLDVKEAYVFGVSDDIQPNKHYVTIQMIASEIEGEVKVMEPDTIDKWEFFDLDALPENIYSPSKKFIDAYLERKIKDE